jgi:hypothetical protein
MNLHHDQPHGRWFLKTYLLNMWILNGFERSSLSGLYKWKKIQIHMDKLQPLITEIETIIGHAYGKQEG